MSVKEKKSSIRKKLLQKRQSQKKSFLDLAKKKINKKIENLKEFQNAKKILFYMPIKNEVNLTGLIKKSLKEKEIFLPKVKNTTELSIKKIDSLENLKKGKFSIPEPGSNTPEISIKKIDLILVPGIAYDKQGHRIGFGKGYYDQFLINSKCPKIAPAYSFQVLEKIPAEKHDQKVDLIITEKDILFIPPNF